MNVTQACYADIAPLGEAWDNEKFFVERYERQKDGLGMLFVARSDGRLVGDVYLWLEPAEEYYIRKHLPGVALLTHLEVLPEYRSRGIGTELVDAVETYLLGLGHDRVALAVRVDNVRAAALYERLGYEDWGHGELTCYAKVTGPDGHPIDEPELCHIMVRELHSTKPSSERTFSNLRS